MTIGEKIRTQRKALGLNQTELGEKLGVKTNAVSKWECGRVEDIPMSKVKAMAVLFNVRPSYLIDDECPAVLENMPIPGAWDGQVRLFTQLFSQLTAEQQALIIAQIKGILSNR